MNKYFCEPLYMFYCFYTFKHYKKKKKEKITIDFDEQIGEVSDQIFENSIIEPNGENVICNL